MMNNKIKKAGILIVWLLIWQGAAVLINNDILLAGPVEAGAAFFRLLADLEFYKVCMASAGRILSGFFLALVLGILAGGLSYRFPLVKDMTDPALSVMKSIPVASFVVLLLIWQGAGRLSFFISFFVVFPGVCISMRNGLEAVDPKLLEMADIFRIRGVKRQLYIYRPALLLFLISGMEISVGMAFKSGAAAEVIGMTDLSIGEKIYISKVYLDTPGLFAWTAALILLSFLAEKAILKGMFLLLKPIKLYPKKMGGIKSCDQKVSLEQADAERGEILLTHLGKSFGEKEILQDIDMRIQKGGCYLLMGPSGSGKTTLLRIIAGLERADRGEITGQGQAAFLFQEDRLLENEFTVTNVMLTRKRGSNTILGIPVEEALSEILPRSCFYKPVRTLSGGMKRRCALARTMFYNVENRKGICLLDEPFAGLDESTKRKTADFIKKYLNGRTLIVTTHDEEDAKLLGGSIWSMKKDGSP